jgi:hypothetical protein
MASKSGSNVATLPKIFRNYSAGSIQSISASVSASVSISPSAPTMWISKLGASCFANPMTVAMAIPIPIPTPRQGCPE